MNKSLEEDLYQRNRNVLRDVLCLISEPIYYLSAYVYFNLF